MPVARLALIVALSVAAAGAAAFPASAAPQGAPPAAAPAGAVGSVRYIYRGLAVQPPRQSRRAAHTHDTLFDHDGLHTDAGQKASIGFTDGTVLQINQLTDATLSAHVTTVQRGEAAE